MKLFIYYTIALKFDIFQIIICTIEPSLLVVSS